MQRNGVKINESHINTIALKARLDNRECGYLWKRSNEISEKWQNKWFALYQNFLFYYENVNSTKPLGLILLESCYCNKILPDTKNTKKGEIKLFCFSISYTKDGKNTVEFGAETEEECNQWMNSITNCSYNMQASLNTELQQKYIHLSQLYETESELKWKHLTQIDKLSEEVKKLREELKRFQKQSHMPKSKMNVGEDSEEMRKIKKVQSFCRGWLYRKRWKRIVKDYIESPHAVNLRKRNRIVLELVEKEGEYMSQLEILVSNFLRPFKMSACSQKAPISHEEINCIFLNSEILLFLHQIFYKGLKKKLENWPTLFIGDLFDFLLPVLCIYQEYVRNHHYSLQILADLKQKSTAFRNLLSRYEEKPKCEGRSLDVFLTYPMHQIPRYILILHQLIAHTSHLSTNEHKSLENAKVKLEELSKTMHHEVSETENIRYNLGIEKMIVEGCECLLDANQVFIREGMLIILTNFKTKTLGLKFKISKKRNIVKCFLFSNHLIVTTRNGNGKLNLFKPYEAIALNECKLIEEIISDSMPIDEENCSINSDDQSILSASSDFSSVSLFFNSKDRESTDLTCEFKLIQQNETVNRSIHFLVSSVAEKESWCSDISQCIENLSFSSLLQNTNISNTVNMPNKANHIEDRRLYLDEADVKYCKSLNSCKIPQIKQASTERLMERLLDLRFLSIDFLNTFLLTYRVFTDPMNILNSLKKLHESSPRYSINFNGIEMTKYQTFASNELSRKVSIFGTGVDSLGLGLNHQRLRSINEEQIPFGNKKEGIQEENESETEEKILNSEEQINSNNSNKFKNESNKIEIILNQMTKVNGTDGIVNRTENISTNNSPLKQASSSSNLKEKNSKINKLKNFFSNITISFNNSTNTSGNVIASNSFPKTDDSNKSDIDEFNPLSVEEKEDNNDKNTTNNKNNNHNNNDNDIDHSRLRVDNCNLKEVRYRDRSLNSSIRSVTSSASKLTFWNDNPEKSNTTNPNKLSLTNEALALSPALSAKRPSRYSGMSNMLNGSFLINLSQKSAAGRSSISRLNEKLIETQNKKIPINIYAGAVVTSSRLSRRRISNSEATKAFAVATSGCQPTEESKPLTNRNSSLIESTSNIKYSSASFSSPSICYNNRMSVVSSATNVDNPRPKSNLELVNTAASMRVLNILRHWVTKHPLDFNENQILKDETLNLVNDILNNENITDTEQKVAYGIIQQLNEITNKSKTVINISKFLAAPSSPSIAKFCDLSVSEIAEQMTFIDYQIFCSISCNELLANAWMKPDKEEKAPNILLFSKRFNDMSQLVVTEIVLCTNHQERLEKLEKWITIANICKFLKNFNGVLQIMSAFASTSIFRLKKTWEALSKNNQQTIETLQTLVSSDGRFKNLRDAMRKCDPPCIPYLGMYLMDLVFIEESTPDFLENKLVNFSKLRMVSHIVRDIRTLQNSKYTIHYSKKVCDYLLDTSGLVNPDQAYVRSLALEPRN